MKHRILILIGIVALLVGGVVFVAAQGGQEPGPHQRREGMPPPPPPMGVPDIAHLTQAFGLTEAQAADLKPFLDAERATFDGLQKRLGDTHQQIEAATKDGHFDEAQVRALAAQHVQVQADLIVEQERVKARIYNALTPDQRTKMEQMHRRGGPHPGGPGGPGGHGGPPPPPPPPQPDN